MTDCLERKVFIFKSSEVLPTWEDSYNGDVMAMTDEGYWCGLQYSMVQEHPNMFIQWMQYPDLVQHLRKFSNV